MFLSLDHRLTSVDDLGSHWRTGLYLVSPTKSPAFDFGTVSMCRRLCASVYVFLPMFTNGVVHGVHKVVIPLSFDEIQQYKVS